MINVGATFKDKRILFVGATGFVGKVALSMLLDRYPELGKVFVLVRPGAGSTSEQRFFGKVVKSPVFDPIRARYGGGSDGSAGRGAGGPLNSGFEAFLRDKCVPVAGDAARANLNFTDEDFTRFGKIDCLINCAGLVSFTPSLETAMRINTYGVRNVLDAARKTGAGVVHISTCFVAGNKDGDIWEDEPLHGYFPRRGELRDGDFHVDAEIADCERLIAQTKALADDRQHLSMFRDKAADRLRDEGRDPDDENTLRLAVARERKVWVAQRLTDLGMERAHHWGWPNIYTYTKSLGDQVLAAQSDVRFAIVRPSIVETSVAYPFKGWNEGFTTSAPLTFLMLKGQRNILAHPKANLDVVPVDLVASAIISAAAAVIAGTNKMVYQAATSDTSPMSSARAVELTALYVRRYWKGKETGSKVMNRLRARMEAVPRQKEAFDRLSTPMVHRAAEGLSRWIEKAAPRWGAPRLMSLASDATERLGEITRLTGQLRDQFDLFTPFTHDRRYVFRSDNLRELHAQLSPEDREKLPWNPEAIDWRAYWIDNHMPALRKWIFPDLEDEFKTKPRAVYQYKHMVELFDATTKLHRSRTALRLLPPPGSNEPVRRYTYRQLADRAARAAANLRDRGVAVGDRVLICAEGRPEWSITYFGALKCGGVAVPVDAQATELEVVNILRSSGAKVAVLSDRVRERLATLPSAIAKAGLVVALLGWDEVILTEPKTAVGAVAHSPKGDDLASLIFTSGTTGNPKGVMLSHRNFTALLSKLAPVFNLRQHDKLLSVLPLHHTFEFTAGLLMPIMLGAQITYLDEVNADTLNAAFDEGEITGMIGVPALWQLLHRKIKKNVSDGGAWVEEIFDLAVEGSRRFRDQTGLNVGKVLFWPVQKKLGGQVRLLVSGGSALPPEIMKAFRGLGFSLYEGYGLTEAAPVLTVQRPSAKIVPGTVGEALPGIELKILDPDERGVGEVIANGPNVMMGYYEDPDATAAVIKDGWLYTGDLGKLDEDKQLTIVGRKKEMILAANGENVYPDELEELYRDAPWVKELSIVGLPEKKEDGSPGTGELVACLLVPDYEAKGGGTDPLPRAEIKERVLEHVKQVSAKLPAYKRVKVLHLWDFDLPRTATRKVKRRLVVAELEKLERTVRAAQAAAASAPAPGTVGGDDGWLLDLVAQVSQKPRAEVTRESRLDGLGFDSLMYSELGVALEAAGVALPETENLAHFETVGDLAKLAVNRRKLAKAPKPKSTLEPVDNDDLPVARPLVRIGRTLLERGQKLTYERLFHTKVTGRAYLPHRGPFLVAANHASHLDMGLVKHALGDWGDSLVALAAKDYFFEDRLKRAYFENFTNLVPMDRHGSLRESLRLASNVLHDGKLLLIFPEGTRSEDGVLREFKPSIGYLSLANEVDVLPVYLEGTYDALPKGASWPKQREIAAHIGPVITVAKLRAATDGMTKAEAYREAARIVEASVRKLGKLPPMPPRLAGAPSEEQSPLKVRS